VDVWVDLEYGIRKHELAERHFPILVSLGVLVGGMSWATITNVLCSRMLHLAPTVMAYFTGKSMIIFLLCGGVIYWLLTRQMRQSRLLVNALERERAKYEEMLETIYDGYYEVDLQGQLTQFNTSLCNIFGMDRDALTDTNVFTHIPLGSREEILELRSKLIENSDPGRGFSWKYLMTDGSVRFLEASATLIVDAKGKAIGFRGIVRNTTGRIRAQEAIADRENQLRSLLNAIPECVIMKDGQGRWLVANDHTFRLFGIPPQDYRGKRGSDLAIHSESYGRMLLQCASSDDKAWETGVPVHLEQYTVQSDGMQKLFEIIKLPEFSPDGKPSRIVVVARDVTERRRTDELIMKSEKLSIVGQLAAGVAHEIRNPLTSIRGFVQLLEATSGGNPEYFHIILAELLRIESIINEFLLLAKPEAIRTREVNIQTIIQQTVHLLSPQALLHNVHIEYIVDESPPFVECEPNHLKQVFINLLKNAIESMDSGGQVQIRLKVDQGYVVILFVDEGCGIPKERLDKLGEPFYTTKEKGTGVGLMVTQRIIETHKGTLTVNSVVGQGTCVEVRLPLFKRQ
jgi:PAS domain S-box-containing protein